MMLLVPLIFVSFVNVWAAFGDVDMATFPTTSGFTVNGPFTNAYLIGKTAGDVNGDGLKDLIYYWAASPSGRTSAGAFYCMFGKGGYSTIASSALTTGSTGFYIYQAAANDYTTWLNSYGSAGDVNNDGYDDLLLAIGVGDPTGRTDAGIIYIILGHSSSTNFTTVDLLSFTTGASGVRILGPTAGQNYGSLSTNPGDINGDGYDDVMVGSRERDAYMIFGRSSWSADVDLNGMTSSSFGFKLVGFWQGISTMGNVGDFNNDGYADYAIGFGGDFNNRYGSWAVFVFLGHSSATAFAPIDTLFFPASDTLGFRVYGADVLDQVGEYVPGTAGDFNGDGAQDLLLVSRHVDYSGRADAGAAYVIFGTKGQTSFPTIDLANFAFGTLGFKIVGGASNANLGYSASCVGDINGDGISDIAVGAPFDDYNGRTDSGTIYVIYGHKNTTSFATIDTASFASGALGFRIFGASANDHTGDFVSGGGDINGDRTDDLILVNAAASSNSGKVQVFYGVGPPTAGPTAVPTKLPTALPTLNPTALPTLNPSIVPTIYPTAVPTIEPSCDPSIVPTLSPSARPTGPTSQPSAQPSCQPSGSPSSQPSSQPSIDTATFALIQASPTYKLRNAFSFAALSANGSVYTWGEAPRGGDSAAVQHLLVANVTQIVHGQNAFAALKSDGSIVPWGVPLVVRGAAVHLEAGNPAAKLIANEGAFAGVSARDGAVLAFGSVHHGGDVLNDARCNGYSTQLSSGVQSITASAGAFAALKTDGSVYAWGNKHAGADVSSTFLASLQGCTLVVATRSAFAVLLRSGRVAAWGDRFAGGDASTVSARLTEVVHIAASAEAFVAFKKDSSLVAWGYGPFGGDASAVASELSANVTFVAHTGSAFAALKADGTVVAWGKADSGGDLTAASGALTDVALVVGNSRAFAALTTAGSVVAWGRAAYGGQIPSNKATALSSGVVSIYHTDRAFAALKSDGSVVVWGQAGHGGSPGAAVEAYLVSGVHTICSNDVAFSVIKTDGSVVGWGHPVSIPTSGVLFTSAALTQTAVCA